MCVCVCAMKFPNLEGAWVLNTARSLVESGLSTGLAWL